MNRVIALCLFIHLTASSAFAQLPFDPKQGTVAQTNYRQVLPFDIVADNVVATVLVGGQPRRFVIDTGAITIVSPRFQRELAFPELSTGVSVQDANNRKSAISPVVTIPEISFGSLTFRNTWKNSPADQIGLQRGDQLLPVDGLNTDDQLSQTLCAVFIGRKNDRPTQTPVVKSRKGHTRTLTLTKRLL